MLNNGDVILSVKDLHVKFSLRGKVLNAIRGISLDLYKGEALAIVGESGSGKSVLTKNFIGLLDTGITVWIAARWIWRSTRPKNSGRVSGASRSPWSCRTR